MIYTARGRFHHRVLIRIVFFLFKNIYYIIMCVAHALIIYFLYIYKYINDQFKGVFFPSVLYVAYRITEFYALITIMQRRLETGFGFYHGTAFRNTLRVQFFDPNETTKLLLILSFKFLFIYIFFLRLFRYTHFSLANFASHFFFRAFLNNNNNKNPSISSKFINLLRIILYTETPFSAVAFKFIQY